MKRCRKKKLAKNFVICYMLTLQFIILATIKNLSKTFEFRIKKGEMLSFSNRSISTDFNGKKQNSVKGIWRTPTETLEIVSKIEGSWRVLNKNGDRHFVPKKPGKGEVKVVLVFEEKGNIG